MLRSFKIRSVLRGWNGVSVPLAARLSSAREHDLAARLSATEEALDWAVRRLRCLRRYEMYHYNISDHPRNISKYSFKLDLINKTDEIIHSSDLRLARDCRNMFQSDALPSFLFADDWIEKIFDGVLAQVVAAG